MIYACIVYLYIYCVTSQKYFEKQFQNFVKLRIFLNRPFNNINIIRNQRRRLLNNVIKIQTCRITINDL